MTASILQLHERREVVAAAQTPGGKFVVWLAGIALLAWHDVNPFMLASFTLVLILPERRRWLLMLATFGLILGRFLPRQAILDSWPQVLEKIALNQWIQFLASSSVAVAAVLAIVAAAIWFERLPAIVRRHPLLILHVLLLSALVVGVVTRLRALLMAPFLLWRASYLIKSAAKGGAANTGFRDHLFYLVPVFGGTNTPYGKGLDYLGRREATDPESFARSQLAGIKLLGLAIVLAGVLALMRAAVHGSIDTFFGNAFASWSLNLPDVAGLMRAGADQGIAARWISIYLDLFDATLRLAIWGHVIIGCLRLLGFNVFRNTYRPLLARSIVEFWNRYYYYFKELLVDFFFYPTYFRSGWAAPRLRLLLAILAAAFAGNVYYHLLREYKIFFAHFHLLREYFTGDVSELTQFLFPRMIYCLLLALGIWLSMLRQEHRRKLGAQTGSWAAIRAIAGVWTFYGLIHLWIAEPFEFGMAARWRFCVSLIGL